VELAKLGENGAATAEELAQLPGIACSSRAARCPQKENRY
jgi:hypothetical protein